MDDPSGSYPPYPKYDGQQVPPSVADTIVAGRDLRVHKPLKKPSRPPPRLARARGATKGDKHARGRNLRHHSLGMTDRLEHLARPTKRGVISMWREHADKLPADTIARVRAFLDADIPMKPEQAYEHFEAVKNTAKRDKGLRMNKIKKDLLAMIGDARYPWAQNATVAVAKGIQQRLSSPGTYTLDGGMLRLSKIILDEICGYMHTKTPSRRSSQPKAKFMMEMSDKLAIWIDEILSESDDRMLMMDVDEDEDVLNEDTVFGGAGGGDAGYADDFLNMMSGGGLLKGPKPAYLKFQGEMLEAFLLLTDAMYEKGDKELVSYGKCKQSYREAADELKETPDFHATEFNTVLAQQLNKDLTETAKPVTPQKIAESMKGVVDMCANQLAQYAEDHKDKGPAFKLLVQKMHAKGNEQLYHKGKAKRTYAGAARELEASRSLETDYDDPNLSQEIHKGLSKAVENATPAELKSEMEETLDISSKYLSQRAVDENERGPAFDLLVSELELDGADDFTPEFEHIGTKFVAAYILKSAPGLTNITPDQTTVPRFTEVLHAAVDPATPKPLIPEMKEVIGRCANYLSAFVRDRDKVLKSLLEMMKSKSSQELAKRNDYSMDYGTGAHETETAPSLAPFLSVKDIAEEIKGKLTTDMENQTPPELKTAMKCLVSDVGKHLSQSVALRSGAAGERYALNFLAAAKKTLGGRSLFKYKAYGQTYSDAADVLKYAGPLETDHSHHELHHQIHSEMKRGVPTRLAPTVAATLADTMHDASKHLAKQGAEKGHALDHLVKLMEAKGEAPLGVLQGYEQTYTDGARRLTNALSLANDKVDKATYESVRGKLTTLNAEQPNEDYDKHMAALIEDSSKFLSAPLPETPKEKRGVLGDLLARKGDEILGKEGIYKMTYKDGGQEIAKAPVNKTTSQSPERQKELLEKVNLAIPNKRMQELLKDPALEGAAHLTDTLKGRGEALQIIHDDLKAAGQEEFLNVDKYKETHEEAAKLLDTAEKFSDVQPSPSMYQIVNEKITALPKTAATENAKKYMAETVDIATTYLAGVATQKTAAERAERIRREEEAEEEKRRGRKSETEVERRRREEEERRRGGKPETEEERRRRESEERRRGGKPETEEERRRREEEERRRGGKPETEEERRRREEEERRRGGKPETEEERRRREEEERRRGGKPETEEERRRREEEERRRGGKPETEEERRKREEEERRRGGKPETEVERRRREEEERRRGGKPETEEERRRRESEERRRGGKPETEEERRRRESEERRRGGRPETEEERRRRESEERRRGGRPETEEERRRRESEERRRGGRPETEEERRRREEEKRRRGGKPETEEERRRREEEEERRRAGRAEYDPEKEAALKILHQQLNAKGHEVLYKQPPTELTHKQASDWIAMKPPRKVDKAVKGSADTGRLQRKFERRLNNLVEKVTPPQMLESMQDAIIESSRILSEYFVSDNYKALVKDTLISEMQNKCNEILIEVDGNAETFFFAAQRLKKAKDLDVKEPCDQVSYFLSKKLDDTIKCRSMARKLTLTMKEHVKDAANYLSEHVTKPDEQIEAYVSLLGEMETKGDMVLIEGNIPKSYKNAAAYLRQLTSFEDQIRLPNSGLQSSTEGKLNSIMANVPARGYTKAVLDGVIKDSTRLLVSYIMLQGEKTEALKILIQKMEEADDQVLLRHGTLRKSYADGANILHGKNADQLSDVQNADPVVSRKIQIKLFNLMEGQTPEKYHTLMDNVIEEVMMYLAVFLLQPKTIRVCRCMKNVFVQCELWCDEILRRVTRPCCTCSRHVSAAALAGLGSGQVSVRQCPALPVHPAQPPAPCPASHRSPGCGRSPTASYMLYSTKYRRHFSGSSVHLGRDSSPSDSSPRAPSPKSSYMSSSPTRSISPKPRSPPRSSPTLSNHAESYMVHSSYSSSYERQHITTEPTLSEARSSTDPMRAPPMPGFSRDPVVSYMLDDTGNASAVQNSSSPSPFMYSTSCQRDCSISPPRLDWGSTAEDKLLGTYRRKTPSPTTSTSEATEHRPAPWQLPFTMSTKVTHQSRPTTCTSRPRSKYKSGISRTPIISTDQMSDWHAMMVSLVWNVQAWRDWIQENIDRALSYKHNPNITIAEADNKWKAFQRRAATEALQWRQYHIFSRQLTQRLAFRYRDKKIVSPTRASNKTKTYMDCQQEMLEIIEMFHKWTQWLTAIVKETSLLTQVAGVPMHDLRWGHLGRKVKEYADDWAKYNMHLKVCWEHKYRSLISDWLPTWKQPGPVWVVSAFGAVPSGAVAAGVYASEIVWVARTTHRCYVMPAALHPAKHCCIVYADGGVHQYTKYQVMCNAEAKWLPWRAGAVGALAVRVAPGVFVGRVQYRGSHLVGAVHAPRFRCHVVIFDRPFAFNCYELLVLAEVK